MWALALGFFIYFRSPQKAAPSQGHVILPAWSQAAAISLQLGTKIQVSRELKDQPVLLLPRGGEPAALLKALAFALHASIDSEGGIIHIRRTKSDLANLKTLDIHLMAKNIQSRLKLWDEEIKEAAALGTTSSQVAHFIHINATLLSMPSSIPGTHHPRSIDPELISPVGLLMRRIVGRIKLDELAGIAPEEIRVYSNSPTDTERGIQPSEDLIQQFAREQIQFSQDPLLHEISEEDKRRSHEDFVLPRQGVSLEGLKCLLTATRYNCELNLMLEVFNSRGELVGQSWIVTRSRDNYQPSQRSAIVASQHPDAVDDLNAEQLTYERALLPPFAPISSSDPLWLKITYPDRYDPANILVPTALAHWIDSDHQPIVAVIGDDLTYDANYCVQGNKLNTASFEAFLIDSTEKVNQDGVRILRPTDPLVSDSLLCDRSSLGSSLRRFEKLGQVDLRGWSILEKEQGLGFSFIPQHFVGIIQRSLALPAFSDMSRPSEVFQLMGSTPEEKWMAMANGAELDLSGESVREKLWDYLLSHPSSYKVNSRDNALDTHITELFPTGLPQETHVLVREQNELILRPKSAENLSGSGDMDITMYVRFTHNTYESADSFLKKAMGTGTAVLDNLVRRQKLFPCTRTVTEVSIELEKGIRLTTIFHGVSRTLGQAVSFTDLPENYKALAYAEWNRLDAKPATASRAGGN